MNNQFFFPRAVARIRVLDVVGVQSRDRVIAVRAQRVPVLEQIRAGFAEFGARKDLRFRAGDDDAQPTQRLSKLLLSQRRAFTADIPLVPLALKVVEPTDLPKDPIDQHRRFAAALEEVRPRAPSNRPK